MKRLTKDACKSARSLGVIIVASLVYSPFAFAELKIYEVQPWPIDTPNQLVIWGHGFDDLGQLEIMSGTHPDPLIIYKMVYGAERLWIENSKAYLAGVAHVAAYEAGLMVLALEADAN